MVTAVAEEIIDEKIIENCEVNGACSEGLEWLREKPRTFSELKIHSKSWFNWLAENSSLPEVLSKLAEDANSDVRYYVAGNTNSPVEVLSKLAEDANSAVRYAAKRRMAGL